jgi:hypothetical protein
MVIRVARHTNNLKSLVAFYCDILNFDVLGSFEDHDAYNGVFLGRKDLDWHLEFTTSLAKAQHQFDEDDILVFYPKSKIDYSNILHNIKQQNIKINTSKNPYWNENGVMIQDPDGFNVIISDLKIP